MIRSRKAQLPVQDCCRLLGVSRASVYRRPPLKPTNDEEIVRLAGLHPRYGYRRLAVLAGINKKAMRTRMSRLGLMVARKKHRTRTTFPVPVDAPNLCGPVTGPAQLLVSDFTYIPLPRGFAYFAVTLDVFSRRVCGWSVSQGMTSDFVVGALQMTIASTKLGPHWIQHSDRGAQYASEDCQKTIRDAGGTASFSSPASPGENSCAESFFARFKDQVIHLREPRSFHETQFEIQTHVEDYNLRRPHSSLG
jgi:putative transposase